MTAQGQQSGYVIRLIDPPIDGWINRQGGVHRRDDALRFSTAASAEHWVRHHVSRRFSVCEIWSYRAALESQL